MQTLSLNFSAIGVEAYIPTTDIEEAGIYTVQRLDRDGYGLEGGLRYDRRTLTVTPFGAAGEVEREFDNFSASAAVFFQPAAGLFADGLHIATAAYEVSDPTLDNETFTTLEGTLRYVGGRFRGDLHVYASKFDGLIDVRDTGDTFAFDEDGKIEEFPIFAYQQTDADFRGFEAEVAYDVWTNGSQVVTLEGAADFVDADTVLGLAARIRPYSVAGRVCYTSTPVDLSVEVRHVGEQDEAAEFERPTDSYTLLNLFGALRPFSDPSITFFAEGRNLTDEEAREHASFLKDIALQPGRNLRVGVSYRF